MTEEEIRNRYATALERLDGDVGLLCEMAAMTAPHCKGVIDQLQSSIAEGDTDAAASKLHKLKGMLSTFDSDGVVLEIQEMLEQARRGKLDALVQAFREQEPEIRRAVHDVRQLAESP